ncbi:hypothetical protein HN358_00670 [Candidatus Uhrbacteria bacterium]|jgi:hypothetical protein|nr:hypothetical protein [Candidatus Uhrbacteria bacterium]MBT7717398.1 hypothetical protein [Candidatus Uhrbacteria bacterium]
MSKVSSIECMRAIRRMAEGQETAEQVAQRLGVDLKRVECWCQTSHFKRFRILHLNGRKKYTKPEPVAEPLLSASVLVGEKESKPKSVGVKKKPRSQDSRPQRSNKAKKVVSRTKPFADCKVLACSSPVSYTDIERVDILRYCISSNPEHFNCICKSYNVSRPTVKRWVSRLLEGEDRKAWREFASALARFNRQCAIDISRKKAEEKSARCAAQSERWLESSKGQRKLDIIAKCVRFGMSTAEIANFIEEDTVRVVLACSRLGLNLKCKPGDPMNLHYATAMLRVVEDGVHPDEAVINLEGTDSTRLKKYLRKAGIAYQKKQAGGRKGSKIKGHPNKAYALELAKTTTKTGVEIAAIVGAASGTVRLWIRTSGVRSGDWRAQIDGGLKATNEIHKLTPLPGEDDRTEREQRCEQLLLSGLSIKCAVAESGVSSRRCRQLRRKLQISQRAKPNIKPRSTALDSVTPSQERVYLSAVAMGESNKEACAKAEITLWAGKLLRKKHKITRHSSRGRRPSEDLVVGAIEVWRGEDLHRVALRRGLNVESLRKRYHKDFGEWPLSHAREKAKKLARPEKSVALRYFRSTLLSDSEIASMLGIKNYRTVANWRRWWRRGQDVPA